MEEVLQIYSVISSADMNKRSTISSKRSNNSSEYHVSQSYSLTLPAKLTSISPEDKKIFVNCDLRKYLASVSAARSTHSRSCMINIVDPRKSQNAFNYVISYIDHEVIVTGMKKIDKITELTTFVLDIMH